MNYWLWQEVSCRAPKWNGIWLLEEFGFDNLALRGKHYGTISLKSKCDNVRAGYLCLLTGHLTFMKKKQIKP